MFLVNLQKLLLSHCTRLTELPYWVHFLKKLQFLDLSHTAITKLPPAVRYLSELQKLLLSNCYRLTVLPDSFHTLKSLQLLDISHTTITELPYSVSFLPNLQIVFPEVEGQEFPDNNVVQRTDVSITSKIPPPESSKRLTEDSSEKHGGASDNNSAATDISSDTDTDDPIDAEESLEDIETSKSPPPESPKHMTKDSSAKHRGASDNYSAATEISSSDTDNPINAEESLEDIETSKSPSPESPKHMTEDSSAKHGGASAATDISYDIVPIDAEESLEVIETSKSPPPESPKHLTEDSSAKHGGASAATEISSDTDTDTDDPIDAEESLEDISSPEQESLDVSEISQLKRLNCIALKLKVVMPSSLFMGN
ncbi:hypothetical protein Q3G72_022748 [Acer saccharum]|nr:hypothetical protein Q3G72_022748 [Acer saccharum]